MAKQPTRKIETAETAKEEPKMTVTKGGIVVIPGVRTEKLTTLIIGTAPLICHKFSEKLRKQILDRHKGEASAGRSVKDPHENYMAARYRLTDGTDGVPAGGMKACLVKGFVRGSGVAKTNGKGCIRVAADDPVTNLVRVLTVGAPAMREDIVRNESGVVDIRHRPEYWPWAMLMTIEYLPSMASRSQILQAVAMAGFIEGVCEWRPGSKESLSGTYGTFRLSTVAEAEAHEAEKLFSDLKKAA